LLQVLRTISTQATFRLAFTGAQVQHPTTVAFTENGWALHPDAVFPNDLYLAA
jgi:hypothetical protein